MKKLIGFSLLLIVIGMILCFPFWSDEIDVEYIKFTHSNQTIKGTLYSNNSHEKAKQRPAVILVHGVIVNKEFMSALGYSLAQNGITSLAFDLGGYGESYKRSDSDEANVEEVLTAVKYLRSLPTINKDRIGVVGHSMGGTAAILSAIEDPDLYSVASLGMSAQVEAFNPCRILWSTGLYDPLHTPGEMRRALAQSSGGKGYLENQTLSQKNCLQRLYFSPTANHQTEVFDSGILREVTLWMTSTLNETTAEPIITYPRFHFGMIFTGLGLFILLTLALMKVEKKRLSGGGLSILMVLLGGLGHLNILPPFIVATLILFLLGLLLVSNYLTRSTLPNLIQLSLMVFILVACVDVVNVLNAFWEYLLNPSAILTIPLYFILTWFNYFQHIIITWRPHLFLHYTTTIIPAWPLLAVLVVELIKPGLLITLVSAAAQKISELCQLKITLPTQDKLPLKQVLLLGLLMVGLGVLLWQRAQTGFLNLEAFQAVGSQVIRRFLPTFVLFVIFIRQLNMQTSRD